MRTYVLSIVFALASMVCFAQEKLRVEYPDGGSAASLHYDGTSTARLKVTESTIDEIRTFENAVSLSLFGTSTTDADLKQLVALKNLKTLDLSYTSITDASAESIEQLEELQILSLNGTKITDAALETISKLPQISMLYLARTEISGRGLKHLSTSETLNVLDLTSCDITDAGLQTLGKPPMLQSLRLAKDVRYGEDDKSKLTDGCVPYLLTLDTLLDLDVASSRISESGVQRLREGLKQCNVSTSTHGIVYLNRKK